VDFWRLKIRVLIMRDDKLLALCLAKAQTLKQILTSEFEALKSKDLVLFETLQSSKLDILSFLATQNFKSPIESSYGEKASMQGDLAALDAVLNLLDECRNLHRRNEIFINRKLDSIRSALKTIQSPSAAASVDVYDRLGKIRSRRAPNTMGDA
jgi:flagellar biosynthesis/type III secretory pathway chaperone